MRIRRKKDKKIILIWSIAAVCIIATLIILFLTMFDYKKIIHNSKENTSLLGNTKKTTADAGTYDYAYETSYSGDPFLNSILFEYSFRRTEDYICNRDYINIIGKDKAAKLSNNSKEFMEDLFNVAYKDVSGNAFNNIEKQVSSNFKMVVGENVEITGKSLSKKVAEWIRKNEISMEAEYITDSCMVFHDENSDIIRGQLLFTMYECNDFEKIKSELGIDEIKLGEEYSVIFEVQYVSQSVDSKVEDYTISSIRVINQ